MRDDGVGAHAGWRWAFRLARAAAGPDQHATRTHLRGESHVGPFVAHDERAGEIEIVLSRGLQDHAGAGLAALALATIGGVGAIRVMRAVVVRIQPGAASGQASIEGGVNVVHARVVDDGDLVTSGSVSSGLDLALHLLDRGYGPRVAIAVESLFGYERRGTVWTNTGRTPVPV